MKTTLSLKPMDISCAKRWHAADHCIADSTHKEAFSCTKRCLG